MNEEMLKSHLLLQSLRATALLLGFFVEVQSVGAEQLNRGRLELANAQFVRSNESYFRDGASSSQTSWKLFWKGRKEKGLLFAHADLRHDYQAEEDGHYFKPFDFNLGWGNEDARVTLGRLKYKWSEAEELWRLGTWQPRFTDDQLSRDLAGFTGLFVEFGSERLHWLMMASPIFIPDQDPHFSIQNQKFTSKNPWFKPPTSVINLDGVPTDVRYSFERPDVREIVEHPMAAAQIEWRPTPSFFARLGTAYKPINQLLIGFPIELHLQDPNYTFIRVNTRVQYAQLLNMEVGNSNEEETSWWASLTSEHPIRDNPPAEWTTQETSDAVIGSVFVSQNFRGQGAFATKGFLSYLRVEGGDAPDRGEFIGTESLFDSRFLFKNALQAGFKHSFPFLKLKSLTQVESSAIYDFHQHGLTFSAAISQAMDRFWSARLAVDLIGLVDRSGSQQNGFMSAFRANDRVTTGVQYAF